MRLPKLLAVCEYCHENAPEMSCYDPEEVAWSPERRQWLCNECFFDDGKYDPAKDEYVNEVPLVFAKDALLTGEEQRERLLAAATRRRLGVKT